MTTFCVVVAAVVRRSVSADCPALVNIASRLLRPDTSEFVPRSGHGFPANFARFLRPLSEVVYVSARMLRTWLIGNLLQPQPFAILLQPGTTVRHCQRLSGFLLPPPPPIPTLPTLRGRLPFP